MIQITGAFIHLLNEWLIQEEIQRPQLQKEILQWDSEQNIPLDKAWLLLEKVAAASPGKTPGLCMARNVRWHNLGAFGRILANANTMEELLYRYLAYEQIFYGEKLASIQREKDHIALYWQGLPSALPRVLSQLSIGVFAVCTKRLLPEKQTITEISFPQPANGEAAEYEEFFGCPVVFDAPAVRICLNSQVLNDTPHFDDNSKLEAPTESALKPIPANEKPMLNKITKDVLALLPEGKATVNSIASLMVVSPRTLQRRLGNYPGGLRGLVDDIRYDKAVAYLSDPSLSFSYIASQLGYSEQSAFNLAFRRWTDMTPSEWRAAHGKNGGLPT